MSQSNVRPLDAELFPRLSKFMANVSNGNANVDVKAASPQHTPSDEEYKIRNVIENHHHMDSGVRNLANSNNNNINIVTNNHINGDVLMNGDYETNQASVERIARDWGLDSIDDVNAATAMLALKHGPKVFAETFQTG